MSDHGDGEDTIDDEFDPPTVVSRPPGARASSRPPEARLAQDPPPDFGTVTEVESAEPAKPTHRASDAPSDEDEFDVPTRVEGKRRSEAPESETATIVDEDG